MKEIVFAYIKISTGSKLNYPFELKVINLLIVSLKQSGC